MQKIYVCSECERIVDTDLLESEQLGIIRIPKPHQNYDGDDCPGIDTEAIAPWDRIDAKATPNA